MAQPRDRLSQQLVASSLEFHRLRMWAEVEVDSSFLIRLPNEATPIVAFIHGQGGEEFGITLYRGEDAIESAREFLESDEERPPVHENTVIMGVSFERLEAIPVERRTILNDAGFTARREAIAPAYFVVLPSGMVRMPNRTEMRVLLAALRTLIEARAEGPITTGWVDTDADLPRLRRIEEEGQRPCVVREREALPRAPEATSQVDPEHLSVPTKEPTTLAEWKAVEHQLWKDIGQRSLKVGVGIPEAIETYFGDVRVGMDLIVSAPYEAATSFVEWFIRYWRHPQTNRTYLESWLEQTESPSVRRLLESRMKAKPRFYRVAASDPKFERVELEDVWTGEQTSILDAMMSKNSPLGMIMPLLLIETDVGKFGLFAGPQLRSLEFDSALAFLEKLDWKPDSEGLAAHPEMFGRLFAWQRERRITPPAPPNL